MLNVCCWERRLNVFVQPAILGQLPDVLILMNVIRRNLVLKELLVIIQLAVIRVSVPEDPLEILIGWLLTAAQDLFSPSKHLYYIFVILDFFHLSFFREGCSSLRNADSCGDSKPCPDQEICVTDPALGASACICPSGYARNGRGACVDIDECNEPAGDRIPCGTNAVCKNLPGSYECTCPSGFHGNPYSLCEGNCMVFKSFSF